MEKKSRNQNSKTVLAFDLGGTKIAAGLVTAKGKILEELREPVDLSVGVTSLIAQFERLGKLLLKDRKKVSCAIASAGPLDPVKGELIDPTNLTAQGKKLGVFPLTRQVGRRLGLSVRLENDAAAAVLAEHWMGAGRKTKNLIAVTLGTGLGVGVLVDGHLVRAGRTLHTEAGHILLHSDDRVHPCGCGNYGCAEAFLSGTNFTQRLRILWRQKDLSGRDIVVSAESGDKKALDAFADYGNDLGLFLYNMVVVFSPERIVLSGGFSHASHLFLSHTMSCLGVLLATRRKGHDLMPEIKISPFQDEAGLLGAAFVALQI